MKTDTARMRLPIKVGMYLLSLWLLFVLIFVNKISLDLCLSCSFASKHELLAILMANLLPTICVALLLGSFLCYLWFRHLIRGAQEGPKTILTLEC